MIIMEDLVRGLLPLENEELTAEEAWELCYKNMAEFVNVEFSQFKERLRDHRKQVKGDLGRAQEEEELLTQDREVFPRKDVNARGEPVFDLHPAKDLLRQDVADKKHILLTPQQLWRTRKEYQDFTKPIFRQRIYQAVRREKFLNYLQHKREEGKLVRCKPPQYEYY